MRITKCDRRFKVGKCCLENCADRLAQCWAATDLQFVKKKKKAQYLWTAVNWNTINQGMLVPQGEKWLKNAGPSFLHCPTLPDLSLANPHCLVSSLTPSKGFLICWLTFRSPLEGLCKTVAKSVNLAEAFGSGFWSEVISFFVNQLRFAVVDLFSQL